MGRMKEYGCGMSDKILHMNEPCMGCNLRDTEITTLKSRLRQLTDRYDDQQDRLHDCFDEIERLEGQLDNDQ